MKLKAIKNVVTSKVGRQILTAQKHSPVLLFSAGVVGVVATVVLASRATLKLESVLDEAARDREAADTVHSQNRKDYTDEDYRKDRILIMAKTSGKLVKLYLPAVAVGAVAVGALTGSHIILSRRNVALTAAYAALDKGFRQYRERVVGELGEDKDEQFRYGAVTREIVEETDEGPVVKTITEIDPNSHSPYAKFFDEASPNWSKTSEYNKLFLQCQQNYANDLLRARGHVFLNEVYDMLGIDRSQAGAVVGWVLNKNSDNYVDFGIFNNRERARAFVNGYERSILLDFNVDGVIFDQI